MGKTTEYMEMFSSTPQDIPSSRTAATAPTDHHAKVSLANLAFAIPTNPHPNDPQSTLPNKPINTIHTWVVWSIFNLLFVPLGIVACYLSYRVGQFKRQNHYEKANRWSTRTLIFNIVTTMLMFGVIVAVVMLRYDYDQRNSAAGFNQTRTIAPYIRWQPGR